MKTGSLNRVLKAVTMFNWPEIQLSKNEFIDGNDYFGLIQSEQEPQTFFNIE